MAVAVEYSQQNNFKRYAMITGDVSVCLRCWRFVTFLFNLCQL